MEQGFDDINDAEFRQLLAERIRALGDPTRIHLMHTLMTRGELCVHELAAIAGKSQATVSKHLSILHHHGFIRQRKEGVQTYYFCDEMGNLKTFCEFMCRSLKEHLGKMSRFGAS